MMPTIRVEDDVFDGLKSLAEPFTDTPNSVIRKLLERAGVRLGKPESRLIHPDTGKSTSLSESTPRTTGRGMLTPQPVYEAYLIHVLATNFNGSASKQEATKAVIQLMKTKGFINAADLERVSTGETKAENTIAWGRDALKRRGMISRNSQRGFWELTSKGREASKTISLPSAGSE
ncbi:MAG: hypothetical protein NTV11_09160 [Rhodocyclales bacterium]|nr:hypothetical protein [Rhodocyclales bacterium]